eukprot:2624687-Pleurochrysis_carterae.AAC.1
MWRQRDAQAPGKICNRRQPLQQSKSWLRNWPSGQPLPREAAKRAEQPRMQGAEYVVGQKIDGGRPHLLGLQTMAATKKAIVNSKAERQRRNVSSDFHARRTDWFFLEGLLRRMRVHELLSNNFNMHEEA